MRRLILAGYFLATLGTLPGAANATCGEECDSQYSSDIDDCRFQFGDDPADADDLAACIQEARDDYRSCLDDCANAGISQVGDMAWLDAPLACRPVTLARRGPNSVPPPPLLTGDRLISGRRT